MAVFQRLCKLIKHRKYNYVKSTTTTTNLTKEMSFTVTVPTVEGYAITRNNIFFPKKELECVSVSPNGQFCCFLLFKSEPHNYSFDSSIRPCVAALQFIDLSKNEDQEKKIFKFAEESWFVVTSVYWINDKYIVFLTIDGTSIKQIMFKVNLEEDEFLTKVCERSYVLNNEIVTAWSDWEMSSLPQVMFHGEGYIVWVDHRREKGSSTGLYLIPENPMNSTLRLRKFAMFLSMRNPVVQANERIQMKLKKLAEDSETIGQPLVRNNRLLFWFRDEFRHVIFGVFLAVDIEKLIEVKGLNYDPIEIENKTNAYSMEEWTSVIDREDHIYSHIHRPVQVGKYFLFTNKANCSYQLITLINSEDLSFSEMSQPVKRDYIPALHPFGFILSIKVIDKRPWWTNDEVIISKITGPWKGSSLKDLARRNIMFNKGISQDAKEQYKGVIYQS